MSGLQQWRTVRKLHSDCRAAEKKSHLYVRKLIFLSIGVSSPISLSKKVENKI